jgi:hypothetical protein
MNYSLNNTIIKVHGENVYSLQSIWEEYCNNKYYSHLFLLKREQPDEMHWSYLFTDICYVYEVMIEGYLQ